MFAVTKIQIFESNSQLCPTQKWAYLRCSPSQRYKFLKAIHNRYIDEEWMTGDVRRHKDTNFWKQFTTPKLRFCLNMSMFAVTKIQIFESNSQPNFANSGNWQRCSPSQRYKFLKAIHNGGVVTVGNPTDVRRHKDTNFWKQFTTWFCFFYFSFLMFAVTKIQIFESNSQPFFVVNHIDNWCSPSQRYKFLKAIHN